MVRDSRIELYEFIGLSGASFTLTSNYSLNGILTGIRIKENNFTATGSLSLVCSGTGETIWNLVSGTVTNNVAQSGLYYPVTYCRNSVNTDLSGTSPIITEIPLFGQYQLVGAGLGTGKSGLGFTLIYKTG
jgi:hypothetical protein